MIVSSLHWPTDQPLTSPFPLRNGVFVALRSGDLCSPDSWSKPVHVRRAWVWLRPFISVRYGRFGAYLGWKVFGADGLHLLDFPSINQSEVYAGSVAMQGFTVRFTQGLT